MDTKQDEIDKLRNDVETLKREIKKINDSLPKLKGEIKNSIEKDMANKMRRAGI